MIYSACGPCGRSFGRKGRRSPQFLVAFAALGKMRRLVYRTLAMLVRDKFSIRAETLRYGVSLKKAYMPIAVPLMGVVDAGREPLVGRAD
jgi:hypothetical protein